MNFIYIYYEHLYKIWKEFISFDMKKKENLKHVLGFVKKKVSWGNLKVLPYVSNGRTPIMLWLHCQSIDFIEIFAPHHKNLWIFLTYMNILPYHPHVGTWIAQTPDCTPNWFNLECTIVNIKCNKTCNPMFIFLMQQFITHGHKKNKNVMANNIIVRHNLIIQCIL